jgi:flagellar protein FlaG
MPADLSITLLRPIPSGVDMASGARARARPASSAQPATGAERQAVSAADLRGAIAEANDHLRQIDSELTFQLDDETGRVIARLIDRNTGEVLRQVPNKEALALAHAMKQSGVVGRLVKTDA